jgi:hypothetical protein
MVQKTQLQQARSTGAHFVVVWQQVAGDEKPFSA